jgi:hypothetical protein
MSLERRLTELEKRHPDRPPMVILVTSADEPLSEGAEQALVREAMERNPGRPLYYIVVPPQERGEHAS